MSNKRYRNRLPLTRVSCQAHFTRELTARIEEFLYQFFAQWFLRAERSRFGQCACAQNEAYLIAIRSGDNSMVAVRAIQVLEGLADTEVARPSNTAPGIVLRLVTVVQDAKAAAPPAIEAKVIAASD